MNDCERQADDGCYLSISFLIEHERLTDQKWSQTVAKNLDLLGAARKQPYSKADSWCRDRLAINRAIQPMFDDIADFDRQVFLDEYLINPPGNETCSLTVTIPAEIHWSTEGAACIARFPDKAYWKDVVMRSFFAKHSNGDLSYHVSLQIAYMRSLQHYFGLSVLQKVLFPSEEAEGAEFRLVVSNMKDAEEIDLLLFIQQRFTRDFAGTFIRDASSSTSDFGIGTEKLWHLLVQERCQPDSGDAWKPEFSRALFLLKDPIFHNALTKRKALIGEMKAPFARVMTCENITSTGARSEQADQRTATTRVTWDFTRTLVMDKNPCDELAFLSGFLQNVIDFPRQDESEFLDGTDPLYKDDYFLIFATQETSYEVVKKSRSLTSGAPQIGTCPYVFLVHLTLLHNEALIKRYETKVEKIVRKAEFAIPTDGSTDELSLKELADLTKEFRAQRMEVFRQVEKYLHLNLFRYDTEQTFYERIAASRGLNERQVHWSEVLARLAETIEGFHEQAQQETEARLNKLVIWLAFLSVYQVIYGMLEHLPNACKERESVFCPFLKVINACLSSSFAEAFYVGSFLALLVFVLFFVLSKRKRQRVVGRLRHG